MRIEGIFPSYFSRVPQVQALERPDSTPLNNSLFYPGGQTPAVVVEISPEGWAAYNRYKTGVLQNQAELPKIYTGGFPNLMPGREGSGNTDGNVKKVADVFKPHVCQTCKNRKYQDASSDPSVSFQAPTHINPSQAGAAVAAHEGEHVAHEQAKAAEEGRKIVSQTVTLTTSICPECGRVYISGGVTRTITAEDNTGEDTANNPA